MSDRKKNLNQKQKRVQNWGDQFGNQRSLNASRTGRSLNEHSRRGRKVVRSTQRPHKSPVFEPDSNTYLPNRQQVENESLSDCLIEGRNPIVEAIKAGRTIEKLWVMQSPEGSRDPKLAALIQLVKQQGGLIMEVPKATLDGLSVSYNHQGLIARTAMHAYASLDDLFERAASRQEDPFFIVLDRIQDGYNLGSVLRIADACGAHGVIIPARRSVGLNAVVAKASAGAMEHVLCCKVTNLSQTIRLLKERGLWIIGAEAGGDNLYAGQDLTGPMAIVIGSEGFGIADALLKHCDFKLEIPMFGSVNSLNAAVACGIIAYEIRRQRQLSNP